jgi:tripartite-type tricarboxylate transporter receptor subunit TctC
LPPQSKPVPSLRVARKRTSPHLAGELLKTTAHIDITHIPYKGSGPALADVIGGSVPLMFDTCWSSADK